MQACIRLWATPALLVFSIGCGGDSEPTVEEDLLPVECPEPAAGTPGGACAVDTDCDTTPGAGDGFCLNQDDQTMWPASGYCVRFPATACELDSDCPTGTACTVFVGTRVCLPACCRAEDGRTGCSAGRICASGLFGEPLGNQLICVPGNAEAEDGDPCSDFSGCNENSQCRVDPFRDPGGVCRTVNCRNDDHCASENAVCMEIDELDLTECFETCASDADCRIEDGHFCDERMDPPVCRHGNVGEGCTEDRHCGQAPWSCLTGPDFPGGYCTVTGCDPSVIAPPGCPFPSFCYANGGGTPYCARNCMTTPDCRTGYTCQVSNDSVPANIKNGCLPD